MKKRKSYAKSFKAEAVRLLEQSGKPPAELSGSWTFDAASLLKNEWTFHHTFQDRDKARAARFDYIEPFSNRKRSHASLDYKSPMIYKKQSVS
jgi:transposase InsO family protein